MALPKKSPTRPLDAAAIYAHMVEEASHNRARNASELATMAGMSRPRAERALEALEAHGLAREVGKDASGPCWSPSGPKKPHRNPSPAAVAMKKARDWNQNDDLLTEPRALKITLPQSYIELGEIVAIEYRSKKYDGKARVWRHEVTKRRALHLSTDGSVFIVKPGFKVTKRGIEG